VRTRLRQAHRPRRLPGQEPRRQGREPDEESCIAEGAPIDAIDDGGTVPNEGMEDELEDTGDDEAEADEPEA
jgi:hypothetical protein